MQFTEHGLIMYPYISNNQLIYEVDFETGIRSIIHILPELGDHEMWECFGVDVNHDGQTSTITVSVINTY